MANGGTLVRDRYRSRAARLALGCAWLALAGCTPTANEQIAADVLFVNGTVITMDPALPRAEALAVRAGRIAAVGTSTELEGLRGPATAVIDLDGGGLMPGFHDSHVHPLKGGAQTLQCSLSGLDTVEAILARVTQCMDDGGGADDWVIGRGWSLGLFPSGNPHRALLDEIAPGRPVFLEAEDGHSAWVNGAALRAAGIDRDTPDPEHGVIERDPQSGEPSGTLREMAVDLVEALLPPMDFDTRLEALRLGVREANRYGITSVVDASVGEEELEAYHTLEERGELTVRVTAALDWPGSGSAAFERLLAESGSLSTPLVSLTSVKIFVDGVLEGDTAALLEPYEHRESDFRGQLLLPPEALAEAVTRFDAAGMSVHMHAIGDRAARAALDAVAAARDNNSGSSGGRHQIAHLQLVHPEDYERFGALGIAANFQALWAYPDPYITEINLPQVGHARVERMYPIGSLSRAGARVVAGSDWPVSSLNPWEAIEVALTRRDPRGRYTGVLNASEAVDLDTMLAAYTREAAWVAGAERGTGMLRPGLAADLVWLADDPFEQPPEALAQVAVRETWIAGERVYRAQ